MYWNCDNCICFRQDDDEEYPKCKCKDKIRPCEKDFLDDLLMEQQEQM